MPVLALWLELLKTLTLLEKLASEVSSPPLCPGALYPLASVYHTLRLRFCDKLNQSESAQLWSHLNISL